MGIISIPVKRSCECLTGMLIRRICKGIISISVKSYVDAISISEEFILIQSVYQS